MNTDRKESKNRRIRLPLIAAAGLLLIVVLSLGFGGVFGDEIINDLDQTAGTVTLATPSDDGTPESRDETGDDQDAGYVQMGSDGSVYTDQEIFALRLAEEINGESVTALKDNCLRGSSRVYAVIIPGCITEIGDNAFADCENLETIILEGRRDLTGMKLGENCFGDAELVFEPGEEETDAAAVTDTETPAESGGSAETGIQEKAEEEAETLSETETGENAGAKKETSADTESVEKAETETEVFAETGAADEIETVPESAPESASETEVSGEMEASDGTEIQQNIKNSPNQLAE